MIQITPDPIAFSLFTIPIHWYGIAATISFIIGWISIPRLAERFGIPRLAVEDALFFSVALGVLGARLLHVLLLWEYYAAHPLQIFAIWKGGLAAFGGLLGGMLGVWLAARKHRVSWLRLADLLAPWIFLAFALGRIANIFNGEILGRSCSCWFAFVFPDGIPRHPVQLYGMIKDLTVFTLGMVLTKRQPREGIIFLSTLLAYAGIRFVVEFFREEPLLLFGLDAAQLFLLGVIPFLIGFLVKLLREKA